jgi:hypothetical protein
MKIVYTTDENTIKKHLCSATKDNGEVIVYGGVYAIGMGDTPEEARADLQKHIAFHLDLQYRDGVQMLNMVTQSQP